ncbi:MAG: hypothetical protein ACOY3V_00935 [Pseudomonadota bacterium]
MQEFFNHPAVQAGLAPFVIGLVVAELFHRIKLSGVCIIAGFAVTVYLAGDFSLAPLTSTRKLVWLGLGAAALGLALSWLKARWLSPLLAVIAAAAVIWVVQRILQQQETTAVLLWGIGCALYLATLVWCLDQLNAEPLRAANAAVALGIGTGGCALIGASALLGQLGMAIGAAAGAHLLIQLIGQQPLTSRRVFTLPVAVLSGTLGCVAVLSVRLPWYALPILAAIPLGAWLLPLPQRANKWLSSLLLALPALTLAAAAMYVTWRVAGDVPY